jgi:hypothetical protein
MYLHNQSVMRNTERLEFVPAIVKWLDDKFENGNVRLIRRQYNIDLMSASFLSLFNVNFCDTVILAENMMTLMTN